MPITPLHAFSLLFLYFKDKKRIDPLALTVSATFIDLEALYYLLVGELLDHRIWHGFALAVTLYPILVTIGVYFVERFFDGKLWSVYNALRLKPKQTQYPLLTVYLCSLLGGFTHVFFDMFTHKDMPYVIYPLVYGNPFYLGNAAIIIEIIVVLLSAYSLFEWIKAK
ncbi:MAG: DUF4184 family protein [Candidatus Bathyarchaeota archaeon]|jgi:hypothetical protein|nr:DUF4184 family protein [Candidatus Bathyarchaeota archaeon]